MNDMNLWKHTFLFGASLFLACATPAMAAEIGDMSTEGIASVQQNGRTVNVTVNDAMGPVIGANVIVKGTTIGSITDMDGHATIDGVPNGAVLVISYIGYITQEVSLQNRQTSLEVTLREDSETLDEVVVVGYGTQAKKDITGSVAVVSRDAITEQPVATFAEALQGKASGVYITGGGAPGAETTIRIRGVGSVNGSDPLIIVDGVQGVDVSSVNPNDIESMQVLKDASATAIYGARAANGVIIVTTKQGKKEGKVRVNYSGYYGVNKMANSGYDLLNGWEAMEFEEEGFKNQIKYRGKTANQLSHDQFGKLVDSSGNVSADGHLTMPYAIVPAGQSKEQIIATYGSIDNWVSQYQADGTHSFARSAYYQILEDGGSEAAARRGTDWYDLVTRTGTVQNHELSFQGGGDKGMYAVSLGYQDREGTLKGSEFKRYSARLNSTFNPTKHFTFGMNTNMALMETVGERGTQGDDNTFARTYTIKPWVPAYNVSGDYAGSRNGGGRANTALVGVDQGQLNWSKNVRINASVFSEVKDPWIKGLTLRTQFSANLNGNYSRSMTWKNLAWNKEGNSYNTYSETGSWNFGWQWTNTATYKHTFAENHDMTVVIGTEAIKEGIGYTINGTRRGYTYERDTNTWILNNGDASTATNSSYMSNKATMFGYFGRADYSYKGKYLVTATVRRDASSRFSSKNRWGTFPSLSLGWRISDEKFMEKARSSWLDDLKLRAGYGTTGNSNIGAYNYAFQYGTGNAYMYDINGVNTSTVAGYGVTSLGDVNAKWETSKMFNVGFDLTAFNNKLTAGFDFYIKKTSDMLVPASWSAQAGLATKPNVNTGDMKNTGIDLSLGYRGKIGEVSYNINGNVSWYKNEVVKLGASDLFTSSRLTNITITTEGQPISMFYGYKVAGIYQNEQDVLSYNALPYNVSSADDVVASDWVGRYKFVDVNGDGKINEQDKTIIGNPHPDLTGGVSLSLNWKSFDLSTYLYYSIGNDLFAHYMYYTHFGNLNSNYMRDRRDNSWSPENPDGKYPMWVGSAGEATESGNQANSRYIYDGSYLRMQTLTLGYTLPKKFVSKLTFSRARVYLQMSNVFTITNYPGLDPEFRTTNDRNKGIDYGSYGVPRQLILGVNIDF